MTKKNHREKLRRLAKAATPGPWVSGDPAFGGGNAQCIVSISERAMGRSVMGPTLSPALFDVEFITAANPAVVLDLLDQLDQLDAADALRTAEAIAEAAREYRDIVGRLADDASPAAYDAADDAQDRLFAAVDAEREAQPSTRPNPQL